MRVRLTLPALSFRCLSRVQVVQEMVEGYGLTAAAGAVGRGGGGGAQRRGSVGV